MDDDKAQHSGIPSWTTMLVLLFLAIFAAIGIAYWALYPFFHRH
ncbi:hypothetical protein [Acidobacterium sp. S8]|nr:hypothetical protein [Acidobacterium sp. S8]